MSTATTATLRPMRIDDLPAVLNIERALFTDDAWSEQMFAAELDGQPRTRYYIVAESAGVIVGYAGLFAPGGDQGDIQTIAVTRNRWGNGIGTALLVELLAEAARRECKEIFLDVRADNERAQDLYRRYGFTEVGVRRAYYQPSGTDAIVMRRAATPGDTHVYRARRAP